MNAQSIIILGAGGHAKVVLDMLVLTRHEITGAVTPEESRWGTAWCGIPIIGGDDAVLRRSPGELELANGIGSTGKSQQRIHMFDSFTSRGYRFATVVHPLAIVARSVTLAAGVQVMAGAIVQSGTRIGRNCIINTGAIVDHDCVIGDHVHIAPGSVLSGGVTIDNGAHIGTGATVIQSVHVGANSCVGAGAVVIREVPPGRTVVGVPGRILT